jgi:hypothetical protein
VKTAFDITSYRPMTGLVASVFVAMSVSMLVSAPGQLSSPKWLDRSEHHMHPGEGSSAT